MEAKGVKTLRLKTNSREVKGPDFNEDILLFSIQGPSSRRSKNPIEDTPKCFHNADFISCP